MTGIRRSSIVVATSKNGLAHSQSQIIPQQQDQNRAQTNLNEETVIVNNSNKNSQDQDQNQNENSNSNSNSKEPLIHTDQVNTSSQTLFVFTQNPKRGIIKNNNNNNNRQTSNTNTNIRARKLYLDQEVEESRSNLALISRRPIARMSSSSADSNESAAIHARLLVLNLEVAKSTATLSWALAVQRNQQQPTNNNNIINEQQTSANLGRPKQRRRSISFEMATVDAGTVVETNSFQAFSRSKRDTIRVRPTLLSSISRHSNKRETDDGEDDEDKDEASSDIELERRDLTSLASSSSIGSSSIGSNSSRQKVATTMIAAKPMNETNSSIVATISGESQLDADLPISRRLQMSRVQSLPAPTNTRRPPTRSTTTTTSTIAASTTSKPHHQQTPDSNHTLSSTNSSGSSSTQRPSTRQPTTRKKLQQQNRSRQIQPAAQQSFVSAASSTEPPMVRTPSVSLNRIHSNNSSTVSQRSAKSLAIVDSSPAADQQTLNAGGKSTAENLAVATEVQTSTIKQNDQNNSNSTTTTTTSSTTPKPTAISSTTTSTTTGNPSIVDASISTSSESSTTSTTTTTTTTIKPPSTTISPTTSTTSTPATAAAASTTSRTSTTTTTTANIVDKTTPSINAAVTSGSTVNKHEIIKASDSSSRWLVRLRRFGSNELDLIKITINNPNNGTHFMNLQQTKNSDESESLIASVRQITFKNLSPSSGYEICIESLSANQEIEDKYQILDSNHFLKCNNQDDNLEDGVEETSNLKKSFERKSMSPANTNTNTTTTTTKIKSLCKEFFTLAESSNEPSINFGQQFWLANNNKTNTNISAIDLTNNSNLTLANLRRPKSLQTLQMSSMPNNQLPNNNLSTNHIQLLEINDIFAPNSIREQQFELLSSRPNFTNPHFLLNDLQSIGSTISGGRAATIRESQEVDSSSSSPSSQFNLTQSALPILGCVFGIIFIMTLANILLNSISCWPNKRRRREDQSPLGFVASSSSARRRHQRRQNNSNNNSNNNLNNHLGGITSSSPNQQLGSSFYSDNSDISAGSQARFMVVGGKDRGEPAFAGSTVSYFEMPTDPLRLMDPTNGPSIALDRNGGADRPSGQQGQSSANYLIAAQANRFPLGPSFEGDEKHNADMVGLARKNYDNFINNIYNPSSDNLPDQQQQLNSDGKPSSPSISSSRNSQHNHRHHQDNHNHHSNLAHHNHHHHQHHHHHHRHHQQQQRPSSSYTSNGLKQLEHENMGSRPISSLTDVDGRQQQQQQQQQQMIGLNSSAATRNKHRLRFDKINPIYHMEGLYGTRATALSSFGQVNIGLDMGPESPVGSSKASSSDSQQCQLCELEQQDNDTGRCEPIFSSCGDQNCSIRMDGCISKGAHCDETVGQGTTSGQIQEFSCCLDRQQQRFHKQQQQLERVMSKNGSLVPQPFINPTISAASSGDELESISNQVDQMNQSNSVAAAPQDKENKQHKQQQVVDSYLFGDGAMDSPVEKPTILEQATTTKTMEQTQTTETINKKNKLVALGSMQKTSPDVIDGTNMQRGDFNQRRKELASKLQLKGMLPQPAN